MDKSKAELITLFARPPATELPPEVFGELQSILRSHSISSQELFYKWESYSMKMGSEETKLDYNTARAFKKDVQELVERESRGKAYARSVDKRGAFATPRNAAKGGDVFGMLDGLVTGTPHSSSTNGGTKRKAAFETPRMAKYNKSNTMSSPNDGKGVPTQTNGTSNGVKIVAFSDRQNIGQVVDTFNDHLSAHEPPMAPHAESRVKLTANTDMPKFKYKPMKMHLSEASEVLDDRIDEFMILVQEHLQLENAAFGNAASQGTNEIVVVGRIASDTLEGRLNAASIVLETSRRMGAGLRVPLKVEGVSHEFFPGQIVAVRGINASGAYFTVKEVLEIPLLPPKASIPSIFDATNELLGVNEQDMNHDSAALNIILASGPYTADDSLSFEPLLALCEKAIATYADVLLLAGPILDIEHPLLATGDFDLPDDASIEPDRATLNDVFRILIGAPLSRLAQALPSITIILVPSVRDAVNKHVSWPQENFTKKHLGLPKQARLVTNPVMISLNEILVGITTQDVLCDLRQELIVVGKPKDNDVLARLPKHLIQQRHFYPIFPPTDRIRLPKPGIEGGVAIGMPLDVTYLKLGELRDALPDMLITPSALSPFSKVVNGVLVINPGSLSKRRGPGTYTQMTVHPRMVTDTERAEGKNVSNKLFERARVDVVRI